MTKPIKFLNFINNLKVLKGENIPYSEFAKAPADDDNVKSDEDYQETLILMKKK